MVEIKLDISKRFMALFGVMILLVGLFAVSYAGNGEFNLPLAWIIGSNGQSVDSDNNGVIDNSDKLTGLTAADLSAVTTGSVRENDWFLNVVGSRVCPTGWTKGWEGVVTFTRWRSYPESRNEPGLISGGTYDYGDAMSIRCIGESRTNRIEDIHGDGINGNWYQSYNSGAGVYTSPFQDSKVIDCAVCVR